jgi:hypothetical protein
MEGFLRDAMTAEIARDAGMAIPDATLREFIRGLFLGQGGEFDAALFEKARAKQFSGMSVHAFEDQARQYLLVDHFIRKVYAPPDLTVTEGDVYGKWKAENPKVAVAYAWAPVAPVRATLQAGDVKPEELETYWKDPSVQKRHEVPVKRTFEALALRVAGVDDQAWRDAAAEWKGEADLVLGKEEAFSFWFDRRQFDLDISRQSPESVKALRAENEPRVRMEDAEAEKAAPPVPKEGESPVGDLYQVEPKSLDDRELYRRYWQARIEKEVWLRKLMERIRADAAKGPSSLRELAEARSRPGLRVAVVDQSDPVDQYEVEKVPVVGYPNCSLRFVLNEYVKKEQEGTLHDAVLPMTASGAELGQRGWVVARVKSILPPSIPPLEAVKGKVLEELLDARAKERARADLEAVRKAAEDGSKTLEEAAKEKGLETAKTEPFNAFSWRPPAPFTLEEKEEARAAAWKDPARRLSAVMARYGAYRESGVGSFSTVLDDSEGTGAFYVVQVLAKSDPPLEEMTPAHATRFRRTLVSQALQERGREFEYSRLSSRCQLTIQGKPASEYGKERGGDVPR